MQFPAFCTSASSATIRAIRRPWWLSDSGKVWGFVTEPEMEADEAKRIVARIGAQVENWGITIRPQGAAPSAFVRKPP